MLHREVLRLFIFGGPLAGPSEEELAHSESSVSEDPEGLVSRLIAFDNAMPRWDNSGRSADALRSEITGRRIFRNPDGAEMKVGRNDSCPYGSGKKYKSAAAGE